ncbi:MAG: hypothetical protein Q9220_000560 [cf. Caloplaca sp. 1 TL-2023]
MSKVTDQEAVHTANGLALSQAGVKEGGRTIPTMDNNKGQKSRKLPGIEKSKKKIETDVIPRESDSATGKKLPRVPTKVKGNHHQVVSGRNIFEVPPDVEPPSQRKGRIAKISGSNKSSLKPQALSEKDATTTRTHVTTDITSPEIQTTKPKSTQTQATEVQGTGPQSAERNIDHSKTHRHQGKKHNLRSAKSADQNTNVIDTNSIAQEPQLSPTEHDDSEYLEPSASQNSQVNGTTPSEQNENLSVEEDAPSQINNQRVAKHQIKQSPKKSKKDAGTKVPKQPTWSHDQSDEAILRKQRKNAARHEQILADAVQFHERIYCTSKVIQPATPIRVSQNSWSDEQDRVLIGELFNKRLDELSAEDRILKLLNLPELQNKLPDHLRARILYYKPVLEEWCFEKRGSVPDWLLNMI